MFEKRILIVESDAALADLWSRHLTRAGYSVHAVRGEDAACNAMNATDYTIIILNLNLADGNGFNVADLAEMRMPEAQLIFVSNSSFFSDGSIFQLCANARALVPQATPPGDLTAMVDHYAGY